MPEYVGKQNAVYVEGVWNQGDTPMQQVSDRVWEQAGSPIHQMPEHVLKQASCPLQQVLV